MPLRIAQQPHSNKMVNDDPCGGVSMKCALVALFSLPLAASAEVTSASESHQHGSGYVSIMAEGPAIDLSLKVPSVDIVGFKRSAETDDERALIAAAVSDLSNPLDLFVFPSDAGCATLSANVALVGDVFGQDAQENEENHTEFHADYQLQCQNIESLGEIGFAYFERFSDTKVLLVEVKSNTDIRTYEVKSQQPVLDLSGLL